MAKGNTKNRTVKEQLLWQIVRAIDALTKATINCSSDQTVTLIPEFITATPGDSQSITTTKNIIDLTWSGGSGTFTLFLPSATTIPYRFLRIVNDSTVTANDKVDIAALPGETIDGAATYEINKAYNGVAVWSDGSNWIVIQAKS